LRTTLNGGSLGSCVDEERS